MAGDAGACGPGDGGGPGSLSFGDADISVTARWVSGGPGATFGISFRGQYFFEIRGDGSWYAQRSDIEGYWIPPTRDPAIHIGTNRLRVRMRGAHIEFYIDGHKLGERFDSSSLQGGIEMLAYNGGEVVFTDLLVRSI